jgi:hypothetical protein
MCCAVLYYFEFILSHARNNSDVMHMGFLQALQMLSVDLCVIEFQSLRFQIAFLYVIYNGA